MNLLVILACIFVASVHGHSRQDKDINTNECYNGWRRVCMECQESKKYEDRNECMRKGKRNVCEIGPESICYERYEDGVYTAGCKLPDDCQVGSDFVTKCHEGIVKPCGYDNWQSVPEFNFCAGEYTICETKKWKFPWECPPGKERRITAMWGRMKGDNVTCTEGVPGANSINADCPGTPAKTLAGINRQCEGNLDSKGRCQIRAKVGQMNNDPCPNVFKYLKICKECIDPQTKRPVLVLLDVSGSMMSKTTSYLPKVTQFLQMFLDATSSSAFFDDNKLDMYVVPFDTGAKKDEEWTLDYTQYESASDLVSDEKNDMAGFISMIEAKEPVSLTNIGQSLEDAFDEYSPDSGWTVFIVSDFINMKHEPSISSSLQKYSDGSVRLFPVILDKPMRNEETFNEVKAATLDVVGFDQKTVSASDLTALFE